MIAIVDYGVGNLFSLKSSLQEVNRQCEAEDPSSPVIDVVVTGEPALLRSADKIILPGVGAFGDAAAKLRENHLDQILIEEAHKGKPLLGICLGMQLLLETGEEYGIHQGLGLIPGRVVPIKPVIPKDYKIPHIGWNSLRFPAGKEKNPLFQYIEEGDYVYFVHSFYAADCTESVIADTEYGGWLTAAVASGNVYGCQFHPEKSGQTGLAILRAFCQL
ncbi:MAG: imidazole glycerol phosphate synthase subunit HisH [Firmicutes bacterium]|nr:imidazole glycerol phosphate synthase subunit HisH [Bacillota bacterium]